MDEYRDEYSEWKTKNEELIDRINRIEKEIDQTQNKLFEKRCYSEYLKEKEEKVRSLQQRIENYDELFKRFEQDITTGTESTLNRPTTPPPTLTQPYRKQRREISEQLELTPELICRQIERIYEKNRSSSFTTPETSILSSSTPLSSTTDVLNRHHQQDLTYNRLQSNIQRLMKNHTSDQYFSLIEDLLKKEIERNDNTIHQFNIKMEECNNKKENDDEDDHQEIESDDNSKKEQLTEKQKLEAISQQQNERLQYIIQLEEDAEHWKNRKQLVEQQLRIETEQKYSDPEVQTAYINYVQSKAIKAEAESHLLFTNHYIDEMKKVIGMLKEKRKSVDHLDSDVHALQEKLDLKKEKVIQLHSENQERVNLIQEEPEKINQLVDEIKKLSDTLNGIKLSNDILTNEEIISKNENPNEKLLNQIGNILNPGYELAPTHIVKRLEDQMFKYNILSSQKSSKLNNDLEALVLSWDDELKEHGIPLPEPSNEMDAIDTVAQAVSTLKEYSDNNWEEFVSNQQKLLTNRLDSLKDGDKYIEDIEQLLDERDTIIKGKIGTDYTVQDRNLEEWFQLADDQ